MGHEASGADFEKLEAFIQKPELSIEDRARQFVFDAKDLLEKDRVLELADEFRQVRQQERESIAKHLEATIDAFCASGLHEQTWGFRRVLEMIRQGSL